MPTATGYTYRRHYEWVDYPTEPPEPLPVAAPDDAEPEATVPDPVYPFPHDPAFHGVRIEVMVNPSYAEVREEVRAKYRPDDDYFAVIAPRVRAWNIQVEAADGTVASLPAPGETAGENAHLAYGAIETDLLLWVLHVVRTGHRPKSGAA